MYLMADKELDELVRQALKERVGRPSKLSAEQRNEVKRAYVNGKTVKELVDEWGVSRSTIMKALKS